MLSSRIQVCKTCLTKGLSDKCHTNKWQNIFQLVWMRHAHKIEAGTSRQREASALLLWVKSIYDNLWWWCQSETEFRDKRWRPMQFVFYNGLLPWSLAIDPSVSYRGCHKNQLTNYTRRWAESSTYVLNSNPPSKRGDHGKSPHCIQ